MPTLVPYHPTRQPNMTAAEARTFRHGVRIPSITRLSMMIRSRKAAGQHPADCQCELYADFCTMNRWRALDRSIREGCRSFPLPIIPGHNEHEPQPSGETTQVPQPEPQRPRKPRSSTARLFCRCMTCEPGAQADHPWTYTVDEQTRQAEKRCKVSVNPDDPNTLNATAQAVLESGILEDSAA